MADPHDLYFVHLSIHGLIRGENLELGRDADTGGQCKYVVELVKELARHERVGRVDLLTRLVADSKVSADYAVPTERIGDKAWIRRIAAGPRRYLRKESLWRYLDGFVDKALALFRENGRLPDVIHAHYGDAGYVGSRLAQLLGCPFIFTGHSLGRTKLQSLLEAKIPRERIEELYNIRARIEAEERSLDSASMVCTSTRQEVESQYALYENYQPDRMRVIPPGVDVARYSPPGADEIPPTVCDTLARFLRHPGKPAVLAIARADAKKNLAALMRAYGTSPVLTKQANLVIVAGNRTRVASLKSGAAKVWTELLRLVDDLDLYGSVAIPKSHEPWEIPGYYRHAAKTRGLFVNPALVEPFGLTLIEAAASGLPVVATKMGGPNDIIANCHNGLLVDPGDIGAIRTALEDALADGPRWDAWSASGLQGVADHYTWKTHVATYMREVHELVAAISEPALIQSRMRTTLPLKDRMVFCGLQEERDTTDEHSIQKFRQWVDHGQPQIGFGICTARSLAQVLELVARDGLPAPDVIITHLGGEIHYGRRLIRDIQWEKHLSHRWQPDAIRKVLDGVPGLTLQKEAQSQHKFKISYDRDARQAPSRAKIQRLLRENNLHARVICSENQFVDVIPLRSGKGQAARYVAMRWGLPFDRILYFARRGSDYGALSGQFLSVLASDHARELSRTHHLPRVYVAQAPGMAGLWEGIQAYRFSEEIIVPASARGSVPETEESESVLDPDLTFNPSETLES